MSITAMVSLFFSLAALVIALYIAFREPFKVPLEYVPCHKCGRPVARHLGETRGKRECDLCLARTR